MQTKLQSEIFINMSHCDDTSHLGIPNTFMIFQDLAIRHGEILGIGTRLIREKHIYWVTGRNHIHLYRRPAMDEVIQAETFLGSARGPRAYRYYRLFQGDETLAVGRTDFVATNMDNHTLVKVTDFFPEQEAITASFKGKTLPLDENVPRISPDFSDGADAGSYTVRSIDIDLGGHMNNTAYAWALAGLFSSKELREAAFSDIDIVYRKPCFEGEVLAAFRRQTENATELSLRRPDGEAAVLARFTYLVLLLPQISGFFTSGLIVHHGAVRPLCDIFLQLLIQLAAVSRRNTWFGKSPGRSRDKG
ncbi:MAG: hypothetical protein J6P72_04150 [Firmicutes bacterium]|nr:hypothetical protein [Bacillota bacterium]